MSRVALLTAPPKPEKQSKKPDQKKEDE